MIGRETRCMNGKKLRYGLVFIVLTTLIYMLMELRYGLPILCVQSIMLPRLF